MKNEINKNRFAYFNVGFILASAFVFWAFQLKIDRDDSFNPGYDHEPEMISIATIYTFPKKEKPIEKKKLEQPKKENPYTDRFMIKDMLQKRTLVTLLNSNSNLDLNHEVQFAKTVLPHNEIIPDIRPSFPGGLTELHAFLQKHLNYPIELLLANRQGKVVVLFTVYEDGSIGDIEIVGNQLGYLGEREALRLMSLMPKWIPGYYKGKTVNAQFIQKFEFRLN